MILEKSNGFNTVVIRKLRPKFKFPAKIEMTFSQIDEFYTDLYRMSEAESWMDQAESMVFIGTSFSVNITAIALRMGVALSAPASTALRSAILVFIISSRPFLEILKRFLRCVWNGFNRIKNLQQVRVRVFHALFRGNPANRR